MTVMSEDILLCKINGTRCIFVHLANEITVIRILKGVID